MDTFVFPNQVHFGAGAISSLVNGLASLKIEKPLIVTDQGLVDCGLLESAIKSARLECSYSLFTSVDANPTEANVRVGVEAFCSGGCDGVVGIGGGSALDAAKGIRLMATHEGPLAQYGFLLKGWEKMINPMPEMIAIPTTAGTGSEVARGALLIEETNGVKIAVVGPKLFPSLTICDPELTINLPPFLTAGTGMDALTHCVEEYLSPKFNPAIEGLALEGIRRCAASLKIAYADGSNIEARSNMMVAAMLGGMGFAKGLGVVHSLSHAIGAMYGGHHGTLNAILLPASLEFNRGHCLEKFRPMAQAVGIPVEEKSDGCCADKFIRFIRELNTTLKMPSDLKDWSIDTDNLDELIKLCQADHCHLTNARPVSGNDFRKQLQEHL